MIYNPDLHHRRSIRLKGYDYSFEGGYFITICTQNQEHFFGGIKNGIMGMNEAGIMINEQWCQLKNQFGNISLDEYVVMPNHFHGILILKNVRAPLVGAPAPDPAPLLGNEWTLDSGPHNKIQTPRTPTRTPTRGVPTGNKTVGEMMGAFKSITTNEYIDGVKQKNWELFDGKLWQRNFYEHIIRNENVLNRIRKYIRNNPRNWEKDELNR